MGARVSRHIQRWRESGMLVLLVLLLLAVFVMPNLVHMTRNARMVDDVLITLILVSGIVAVTEHLRLAVVLAVLSVLVIVMRWGEWIVPLDILPAFRNLSVLGALLVLAGAVAINVFAVGHAIRDRLFGAVVLYLLIGLLWAVAYAILDSMVPGAFAGVPEDDKAAADWAYFSFVTLTTVGYGDITPVARLARTLAILEALVGQLYPAVIIARLVSLQVAKT